MDVVDIDKGATINSSDLCAIAIVPYSVSIVGHGIMAPIESLRIIEDSSFPAPNVGADTAGPAEAADIEVSIIASTRSREPKDKGPVGDGSVVGLCPTCDASGHSADNAYFTNFHEDVVAAGQAQNLTLVGIVFNGDTGSNRCAVTVVTGAVIIVALKLIVG